MKGMIFILDIISRKIIKGKFMSTEYYKRRRDLPMKLCEMVKRRKRINKIKYI